MNIISFLWLILLTAGFISAIITAVHIIQVCVGVIRAVNAAARARSK